MGVRITVFLSGCLVIALLCLPGTFGMKATPLDDLASIVAGGNGRCIETDASCLTTCEAIGGTNVCANCQGANYSRCKDAAFELECDETYDNANPTYCGVRYIGTKNRGSCDGQCNTLDGNTACKKVPNSVTGDDCNATPGTELGPGIE